jgi:hypothetical protein
MPVLFVALTSGASVPATLSNLDRAMGGAIATAVGNRDFRGSRDEILFLTGVASGPRRVALIGIGSAPATVHVLRRAASLAARTAAKLGTGSVAITGDSFAPLGHERQDGAIGQRRRSP